MASRRNTGAEDVVAQIRDDILAGVFHPGERLKFAELQERYGTGVGKMREALVRLVEQGLVMSEPMIGFTVAELTVEDYADLVEARVEIESMVFSRAIVEGTIEWESQVVAAHHHLSRVEMYSNADKTLLRPEWIDAHQQFHHVLLEGCPNGRLREIALLLRDASELYRTWSQTTDNGRRRDVAAEHAALARAVVERSADEGREALAHHIRRTFDDLALNVSPRGERR